MSTTPPSKRAKTHGIPQKSEPKAQKEPNPSGSSSAKNETSRKRAAALQYQVTKWAPGNPLNDMSRLAESSVAGYLGYTDTIHLRHLKWSWPVMKGAMVFETTLKNKLQTNATSILEASIDDADAYEFEANIDTLISAFDARTEEDNADTENTTRALTLLFAGIIHHVANALEDMDLLTHDDPELKAQFTNLRVHQSGVKGFFVPAFDMKAVLAPTLGPLVLHSEHAMERYSRAYTCIRYLLYHTTTSKFATIKGKLTKGTYFESGSVLQDRLPSWMGSDTVVEIPGATSIIGLMNQDKHIPLQVTLQFVHEEGTDDNVDLLRHMNSYLKRKKIRLLKDSVDYKHEIRDFEIAPQWRDHLRHELLLPRLRCDFSTLTLVSTTLPDTDCGPVHVPEEGSWIIYDNDNPDVVIPWTDVLDILQSGTCFRIGYSLKVVDADEDGPYPYEFDGGPIQVCSINESTIATVNNASTGETTTGEDFTAVKALNLAGLPSIVQQEIQSGMAAATSTTLNADLPVTSEDATSMEDFYKMQKLFMGDESQTGPPLDACLIIADAHFDTWHDKEHTLAKYVLRSLPTVQIRPLGHQVTGFLWMILKAYGYTHAPTKEGQLQADELQTARTYGGVLVDNMGLGKTYTSCLYLEWVIQFFTPETPGNYRPHLILAPAGPVIEQWRLDITKNFKGINLILAYGDSPPDGASSLRWISSKAMRSHPHSPKKFPAGLRFIFDQNNRMAAKTVILTSYDTLAARTLQKPRRQPGDTTQFKPSEWIGRWKGVFHTVIMDEGHKVRNPLTNIHVAVARLNARHHWFITGTPIQNQSSDILGPLNILWPQISKSLSSTEERSTWVDSLNGNYKDFELLLLPDVLHTSWKNLIATDPYRVRTLINSKDKTTINKLYRCLEQLLLLHRSTATSIPTDCHGGRLSLKNLMPPYEITPVQLRMNSAEAAEYQMFHQSFVKDYEEGLALWTEQKQSRIDPSSEIKSFPCVTGPLRKMTVNAVSTMLSRFHDTLENTTGFTGLQLAHATLRAGDRLIKDATDLLRHLTFGSPKLRWILKDVTDHCLKQKPDGGRSKLLCSEDIPVSAWFIETVLKSVYIRAEVLHAGLTDAQRIALIQEFNNPHSNLTVLIMMYQVSSQGANLDGACHRVCSITTAINLPSELQVHYRPIRVSQKEKVTIVRLSVVNSHDAWRETKQIDKSIIDVLTKLQSPMSFQAIADALISSRDEVLAAHNSKEGRKALCGRKILPLKLRAWGEVSIPKDPNLVSPEEEALPAGRNMRKRKRVLQELENTDDEVDDLSHQLESADPTYSPAKYDTDNDSNHSNAVSDNSDEGEGITPDKYISDFRKAWVKLSPEDKALYDQDELDFLVLLSMDPDHLYTGQEIQESLDSAITERGLRLVIAHRSGQTRTGMKVSPHIKYNALLNRNEEDDGPFSAPVYCTATDKDRSAALRRFVRGEAATATPITALVEEVGAATIGDPAASSEHVQELALPELILPLDPPVVHTEGKVSGDTTDIDTHLSSNSPLSACQTPSGILLDSASRVKKKRPPPVRHAPFNSYYRQHEPTCLADTRVDLLQEIYEWADGKDGQDERCIFWLNGLAGTGKSTISRTVARRYNEQKRLGASFFFSKAGGDVSHAGKFFTSLAVQLAKTIPSLQKHICDAIVERSDIANLSLLDQWRQLVLGPLSELTKSHQSYVLVVDALDECEGDNNVRKILELLAEARSLKMVRLRVFLTSRPEIPIRHGIHRIPQADHHDFILQNIPPAIINHDISLFLEYTLRKIRQDWSLGADWPGEVVLLVVSSFGWQQHVGLLVKGGDSHARDWIQFSKAAVALLLRQRSISTRSTLLSSSNRYLQNIQMKRKK
ncbi:hypothetical protein VC83_00674, partial [Pseudogymnoascus destructans]